jgi:phosphatidylglycerol:prolipoprotein diacylglycerol transferase
MLTQLQFILWTIDPEIFDLGSLQVRWYGLLFASAFLIGQKIIQWTFVGEGRNPGEVDAVTLYMVVATVIGARLGHCLFYQPEVYLANPIEILKVWEGGLASHGAAVGLMLGCFLFYRNYKAKSYAWVLDRIAITVALAGFLIRSGNLANSEIVGKPTSASWGFVFTQHTKMNVLGAFENNIEDVSFVKTGKDTIVNSIQYPIIQTQYTFNPELKLKGDLAKEIVESRVLPYVSQIQTGEERNLLPLKGTSTYTYEDGNHVVSSLALGVKRHPSQVYEALSCLLLFGIMMYLYYLYGSRLPDGFLIGLFLTWVFILRFLYEYLKENQVDAEDNLVLNYGQMYSIPLILLGLYFLFKTGGEFIALSRSKGSSEANNTDEK